MTRTMQLAGLALALATTACGKGHERGANDAWIRLPAVAGRPAAAYFTLHGGATPATLLAVSTPAAKRTELHESMAGHAGMMRMTPLARVDVPADGTVTFAPAGRHVMLFDVSPDVKPGGSAVLTFTFADGPTLKTTARVLGPADPDPK